MGKLQVNLFGASFAIQANEDEAYLEKLLTYYREIAEEIQRAGNLRDPVQISILSGITLVDELLKEKQKTLSFANTLNSGENAEAEKLTLDMIEKIDQALVDDNLG